MVLLSCSLHRMWGLTGGTGPLQVAWLVEAELLPWSDGIGRQFHRPRKTQAKLTVAFQEVQPLVVSYAGWTANGRPDARTDTCWEVTSVGNAAHHGLPEDCVLSCSIQGFQVPRAAHRACNPVKAGGR